MIHRIGYTSLIGLEVKSPTKYIEADGTTAIPVTARASLRGMIEWVRSSVRARTFSSLALTLLVILHARSLSTGQIFFATPANFYNFHPICELYRQKM